MQWITIDNVCRLRREMAAPQHIQLASSSSSKEDVFMRTRMCSLLL